MPPPATCRCSSASSRPRHHPQQLPRTKVSFISEIARRNLQRIIRYSDSLTCPRQVTKLKNYLFLLCLKIGQRQPQIFVTKSYKYLRGRCPVETKFLFENNWGHKPCFENH